MAARRLVPNSVLAALTLTGVALSGCASDNGRATPSPSALSSVASPSTASTIGAVASISTASYVVVGGDALSAIAAASGVSLDALVSANGWSDGAAHVIRPGDTIQLPPGASPPQPHQPGTLPSVAAPNTGPTTSVLSPGEAAAWRPGQIPGTPGFKFENPFEGAVPSPAFPSGSSAPLADGVYAAGESVPWDPSHPNRLVLSIYRIEACTVDPSGCDTVVVDESDFTPEMMGVPPSPTRQLSLRLDAKLQVELDGYDGSHGAYCSALPTVGTGVDLKELLTAWTSDYNAAIGSQLAAGASHQSIIDELTAKPSHGFSPISQNCVGFGQLEYQHGTAPPLLAF
ncbi:MAG: hypothetical protein JWN39_1791, partial [Ilumatobacteraceae bacterium]|nr:hypothetical protein [Ilumatobacteraceae bacterium]